MASEVALVGCGVAVDACAEDHAHAHAYDPAYDYDYVDDLDGARPLTA